MTDVPRVSVVVPTYRRPQRLRCAVASVLRQTVQDWGLVIVDDNDPGSRERQETEEVVAEFEDDERVRYIRSPRNAGGGAARNIGIRESRSEFVAFLDDDDEWHATKLERQLQCFDEAPPEVGLVYCRVRVLDTTTGRESLTPTDGRSHSVRDLLRRNTVGTTSAVLCRTEALHTVGMFDEALPARQDLDLYIRLAQRYAFAFVDEPLVTLYVHGGSRISTDFGGAILAHQLFVGKHLPLIEGDRALENELRYQLGYFLLAAQRFTEARAMLAKAWRNDPTDHRILTRLALTFALPRAAAGPVKRFLAGCRLARRSPP